MSAVFDAFRLPAGVEPGDLVTLGVRDLSIRYPAPSADLVSEVCDRLEAAGDRLAARPAADLVEALDAAAARFADPGDPIRIEADRLLPEATGYSAPMARLVLDRMAADWRGDALRRLIDSELGDASALDGFVAASPGRRVRAYGPRLGFHVFAGNVPGVAVTSVVRSLILKGPVLGKLALGEPVLPVLFSRALAEVDGSLADALAVVYWPGGEPDAEAAALERADVVVIYGGEPTVRSVRERAPAGTRIVVHGPRFSVGLITADSVARDPSGLAGAVARAVATFDQHGCVSPHAVWLEDPDSTTAGPFADALARAFDDLERTLPRGRVDRGEAARIQQERGAAELRFHARGGGRVMAGPGTSWTVIMTADPAFRPSCLNRFLYLHPVRSLDDAVEGLAVYAGHLQSVAIAAPAPRVEELAGSLARVGVTRITTFDRVPWPPPEWHHDGQGPLGELVRWVDLEE